MNPLVKTIFWLQIMQVIFPTANGELCLPMIRGLKEFDSAMVLPGRIHVWDSSIQDFALLEAVIRDGWLYCSVDFMTGDNLEGRTIAVAVTPTPPYIFTEANYTKVTGYIGDIWTSLEKTLNFTSIFVESRMSSGKTLTSGTIDVLLKASVYSGYPAGHYTYSYQVATSSYVLFALSEGTRISVWWYVKIFSVGLWAMTSVFLIGITCMLAGMYRIKKATCHDYVEYHDELDAVSLDLLCALGGITGQGVQMMPSSPSLRILMITSLMMGLLLYSGFSGNLTSYLASRGSFTPLQSLHDVAQKRTHSLCMRRKSFAYSSSMDSVLEPGLSLKGLINTGNCPDMSNTKNLCKPDVIYMDSPDIFIDTYRQSTQRCKIIQLPGNYWGMRIALIFARFSPYRRVIDRYLLRLHSAGIFSYLERKWISRELRNEVHHKFDFKPVEYGHIIIIFLGLCMMIVLSALICIMEMIWHRIKRKREIKRKIKRRLKTLAKLTEGNFPKNIYPRRNPPQVNRTG